MRRWWLAVCLASLSANAGSDAPEGPLEEKVVGLATLGKAPRKPLKNKPDARTLMRVDFDSDGVPDTELRTAATDSGCGDDLEEQSLVLTARGETFGVRCCGP